MFGYADIAANNAGDGAHRNYAESMIRSMRSAELTDDCVGGADNSATLSSITVLLDGRAYWSADSSPVTAHSIVNAYLQAGQAYLRQLNGSFAIALFDRRTRELTLAIDRMGISTMAWSLHKDRVVFATSPASVANSSTVRAEIRNQAIYEYFFFHMVPSPETAFAEVNKLGARSAVTFNRSGARTWTYWNPEFSRSERLDSDELKSRVRAGLRDAVETQSAGIGTTGAFLSGGLDSSTVTGLLSQISAIPANTFSIGFGVESFNELEYARTTNRHFGCAAHEYEVTPHDIVEAIPIVASAFDEPFGNSSAIPTYVCARYAKSLGMHRLLAGDGGDELFGGNERYARQTVFELFGRIPKPIRDSIRSIVARTIDAEHPISPLRKLRSYIDQASIPLPERYESWNFVYREGAAVMFREDFMSAIDTARPIDHMKAVYESTQSNDLLDRMLAYDWKFTLADNDLRKVVTACSAADIEVAFPFLDNRVVDASIAVPSKQKMNRLELRSFFKDAMRAFLPDKVLTKTKHGFGLPFGEWLKTDKPLADLVYDSLSDLKQRSIVRSAFIDRLIEEHRRGDAGYYGYVIWDLVILEEWLKHQRALGDTIRRTSSRGA